MCVFLSDDFDVFDEGFSGVDSEESVYDIEECYFDFDLEFI